MISIKIMGYTVTYPKDMLVTFNEEKNILLAIARKSTQIHCILDFSQNNVLIQGEWNIKCRINDKYISLEYNYS